MRANGLCVCPVLLLSLFRVRVVGSYVGLENDPQRGQEQESTPESKMSWDVLEDFRDALQVMQTEWYQLRVGTWPTAIDWTAAVIGTHVSASLSTYSKALDSIVQSEIDEVESSLQLKAIENELNGFFSQSTAYYFGENAISIRQQAYDDMLWVVLGWLESIKFINMHTKLHYAAARTKPWYGSLFIGPFSHRAHVFYDLSSRGWDIELCGGGMTWNPNLTPYKNAITNMLWISASASMYLYFPGDCNASPFVLDGVSSTGLRPAYPHDPQFLDAAINGYAWLKNSNMTNELGLYVDGFHITDWGKNGTEGTRKCDSRNEMVYTCNQAVLLSGLRGIWEGTGDRMYLEDGHELVRNAISATGWLFDSSSASRGSDWAGLGRAGILEEFCDSQGNCDQDGQTFKGIFFHHLTLFCEPLPMAPRIPGKTHAASKELALLHRQGCQEYALWVAHNANAAMATRDAKGRFGMWWGFEVDGEVPTLPLGSIDYRNNKSLLYDPLWLGPRDVPDNTALVRQFPLTAVAAQSYEPGSNRQRTPVGQPTGDTLDQDVNDGGRRRTVETQGGGVSVLRTLWELLHA